MEEHSLLLVRCAARKPPVAQGRVQQPVVRTHELEKDAKGRDED